MFAATGYELIDVLRSGQAANEDWAAFAVAFVASAITAFIAVKWLLSYIQSHRFTAFAVYRLVLGAAVAAADARWELTGSVQGRSDVSRDRSAVPRLTSLLQCSYAGQDISPRSSRRCVCLESITGE